MPKPSLRELGEAFSCRKTQISCILKAKDSIMSLYEANRSDDLQLTRKRARTSEYADVNDTLYQWYLLAGSKNIYPAGPQLSEKAKEIAATLGKPDFKASNGWLDKWKKHFNITHRLFLESPTRSRVWPTGQEMQRWKTCQTTNHSSIACECSWRKRETHSDLEI